MLRYRGTPATSGSQTKARAKGDRVESSERGNLLISLLLLSIGRKTRDSRSMDAARARGRRMAVAHMSGGVNDGT